jgi:ribonuclease-3
VIGRRKNPYRELERRLGYGFGKRRFLETALTHRSFRFENEGINVDNQRLEFVGDAALGFAAAAYLYGKFRSEDEGVLTSFRSQITSGKALAGLGKEIDLGAFLRMGKGEEQSGGRKRSSNLADAMEAVIGAAYLDGGMKAVNRIFKKVFVPRLTRLSGDVWAGNPKGRLQEYCHHKWQKGPKYSVVSREGPPHALVFTAEVVLGNGTKARGKGSNKQEAEAHAARAALKKLGLRKKRGD